MSTPDRSIVSSSTDAVNRATNENAGETNENARATNGNGADGYATNSATSAGAVNRANAALPGNCSNPCRKEPHADSDPRMFLDEVLGIPLQQVEVPISDPDDPLPPPRLIRIELFVEPGECAVIEAALDLVRQRTRVRRRGALFAEMAALVLSQSDARSRRRHPVVIETDATTGQAAYVTDRGYLPVSTSAETRATVPRAGPQRKRQKGNVSPGCLESKGSSTEAQFKPVGPGRDIVSVQSEIEMVTVQSGF